MRKKRKRYKVVVAEPKVAQPPARVLAIVTIIQWTCWFALAGVLVAFFLIASLYTSLRVSPRLWLNLWPASFRLMTATGLDGHQMTHLAFWTAGENGLVYGLVGILIGGVHVAFRSLRQRFA